MSGILQIEVDKCNLCLILANKPKYRVKNLKYTLQCDFKQVKYSYIKLRLLLKP